MVLPDSNVRIVKDAPKSSQSKSYKRNHMVDIDGRVAAELRLLRAQMKRERQELEKRTAGKLKSAIQEAIETARGATAAAAAAKKKKMMMMRMRMPLLSSC